MTKYSVPLARSNYYQQGGADPQVCRPTPSSAFLLFPPPQNSIYDHFGPTWCMLVSSLVPSFLVVPQMQLGCTKLGAAAFDWEGSLLDTEIQYASEFQEEAQASSEHPAESDRAQSGRIRCSRSARSAGRRCAAADGAGISAWTQDHAGTFGAQRGSESFPRGRFGSGPA